MEWLSDDADGQWVCEYCQKKNLAQIRNCDGEGNPRFIKIVYGHEFLQCPVSAADEEASRIINMVYICEGGGLGGSRVLPSQLLEETAFYLNVRSIVLSEQRKIEKIKDKQRNREK